MVGAGLIGSGPLACPRGHGPMDKQPGIWVLQQVQRMGLLDSGSLRTTGKLLTVNIHICPACGHVELINEGAG